MDAATAHDPVAASPVLYRHRLATRIWHWLTALTVFIMLGSGLNISNAHQRLYWGAYGANYDPAWLEVPRWPDWLTVPGHYDLAMARRWHLLFALVLGFSLLAFMVVSLVNRHFSRDLRVRAAEIAPSALKDDFEAHLDLRFHDPARPGAYNPLQKLSYVAVIFVLLPLMILTGLAMSPAMDAAWPWLLDVTGGRQSARSIHFVGMLLMALFILVHLVFVFLAGPANEIRSMLTGWWRVPEEEE